MAKGKQVKAAVPYLRRIAEDEYVHKQLQEATARLREVYSRGSRQGTKAAEDKKLYEKAREAATMIRRAVGAIEEPPPKPKRRGRKLFLLVAVAGGAFAAKRAKAAKAAQGQSGPSHEHAPFTVATAAQGGAEPVGASSTK